MSVASRIQEIETHIGDIYDTLEVGGTDLTDLNKNIVNINSSLKDRYKYFLNNGVEVIWNNWEKVIGEGTEFTLENTIQAPMKINLKGNTYQKSTTGKNLFDISKVLNNGTRVVNNGDGTLSVQAYGSSGGAPSYLKTYCPNLKVGDNVILTLETTSTNKFIYLSGTNQSWKSGVEITITQSDLDSSVLWYSNNNSTPATISNIMVRLSSITDDTYEPYTNGASPNPDYPQDIQVVSGDNVLSICGKNLFDLNWFTYRTTNGITATLQGDHILLNGTATSTVYINYDIPTNLGTTTPLYWYVKSDVSGLVLKVQRTGENDINITTDANVFKKQTIVNSSSFHYKGYLQVGNGVTLNNCKVYIDLRKDNLDVSTFSFEPYISSTYPIYLGVENLLSVPLVQQTANSLRSEIPNFQAGTYTFKFDSDVLTPTWQITAYKVINGTQTTIEYKYNAKELTFTLDETSTIRLEIYKTGILLSDVSNAELQKGTTIQHTSTQPIELCKIGDYKDEFIRTSGKNLFDINATKTDYNIYIYKYEYTLKPNTQYTISSNAPVTTTANIYANSTSSTKKVCAGTPQTITSDNNGYFYILVRHQSSGDAGTFDIYTDILNGTYWLQIEEGTQATRYEPYGKGKWYLEKKTRHISLAIADMNNDENYPGWKNVSDLLNDYPNKNTLLSNFTDYMCNMTNNDNVISVNTVFLAGGGTLFFNKEAIALTQTQWKEQYPNLVVELYYGITPTYTEITDSTLINQLEAIKYSYNNQTNISQVNNDMPFKLEVTALKNI